jgi:hypothetical protein
VCFSCIGTPKHSYDSTEKEVNRKRLAAPVFKTPACWSRGMPLQRLPLVQQQTGWPNPTGGSLRRLQSSWMITSPGGCPSRFACLATPCCSSTTCETPKAAKKRPEGGCQNTRYTFAHHSHSTIYKNSWIAAVYTGAYYSCVLAK